MSLFKELTEEYDYKTEETEDKNILKLYRSQYLDNGYGYYFDADITLSYNKQKDEIEDIFIDDLTSNEIDDKLTEIIDKCKHMKKFGCCTEECFSEKHVCEDYLGDCNKCRYYNMISMLYESIDSGNW